MVHGLQWVSQKLNCPGEQPLSCPNLVPSSCAASGRPRARQASTGRCCVMLWEAHTSEPNVLMIEKKNQTTPLHSWERPKAEHKEKCLVRLIPWQICWAAGGILCTGQCWPARVVWHCWTGGLSGNALFAQHSTHWQTLLLPTISHPGEEGTRQGGSSLQSGV